MRATNVTPSRPFNFVTRAENDMAQMMRHRMPKLFIVAVATQHPKVLVRVTGVTMDSVVIVPAHN
jgi:hypothetical protein